MKVQAMQTIGRITAGRDYSVVSADSEHFLVTNDQGSVEKYFHHFFKVVKESESVVEEASTEIANIEGSSSSYYDLEIKRKDGSVVTCTAQDIISSILADNWHFGNLFKAMVRIIGKRNGGGKANTDEKYDANKIVWFGEDFKSRL